MHPSVKGEVDYSEVTKYGSNILTQLMKGNAAGTGAFILDIKYRDQCYDALKIFSCASEEAKEIPLVGAMLSSMLSKNIGEVKLLRTNHTTQKYFPPSVKHASNSLIAVFRQKWPLSSSPLIYTPGP